ncbi:SCP2 domain-containing protein [Pleomorphomonas sp. JP5]|uniref:ubiquinone anaerobic biosynthesis accessory factor UbiT n=1 Tax=Pleomorphomonas sp. JP5 TaxID=2942998 RepID=UPI002042CCB5|nr:SCP2 sterol-binding domain-containing protein [Pleomorphomonas sp. JP5]MCM5556482.1 SCP2 sterol-binding domain-containing protein [Pleomorphomonas sp. JP5]
MAEHFRGELPRLLRILAAPAGFLPLGPALTLAVRRFAHRKPAVFDRLGEYGKCSFLIEPSDLDFSFLMVPDGVRAEVKCMRGRTSQPADVTVRAPLLVLLGLLDGTLDGDAMFFNRAISVSGRTDALVALRNAIEDAELTPADFVGATGGLGKLVDRSVIGGLGLARRFTGSPISGEPS